MNTIDEVLDFAIEQEQIAADFYKATSRKAVSSEMQRILLELSEDELRHKKMLINVKDSDYALSPHQEILDVKVTDYLVEVNDVETLSYHDALGVAMKREKAAFELYDRIANALPEGHLKDEFGILATSESKHKLFFEAQYE